MRDWSGLDHRPRFIYGFDEGEVNWAPALPARAWEVATATVGGRITSAAGVPAAFVVRTDHTLSLPLRVLEGNEWEQLTLLIQWGQQGESFLWYPDTNSSGVYFEVYLESPAAGDGIIATRSAEYPRVLESTLVIRRVDGGAWNLPFYPES